MSAIKIADASGRGALKNVLLGIKQQQQQQQEQQQVQNSAQPQNDSATVVENDGPFWTCGACTLLNPCNKRRCAACGERRSVIHGATTTAESSLSPDGSAAKRKSATPTRRLRQEETKQMKEKSVHVEHHDKEKDHHADDMSEITLSTAIVATASPVRRISKEFTAVRPTIKKQMPSSSVVFSVKNSVGKQSHLEKKNEREPMSISFPAAKAEVTVTPAPQQPSVKQRLQTRQKATKSTVVSPDPQQQPAEQSEQLDNTSESENKFPLATPNPQQQKQRHDEKSPVALPLNLKTSDSDKVASGLERAAATEGTWATTTIKERQQPKKEAKARIMQPPTMQHVPQSSQDSNSVTEENSIHGALRLMLHQQREALDRQQTILQHFQRENQSMLQQNVSMLALLADDDARLPSKEKGSFARPRNLPVAAGTIPMQHSLNLQGEQGHRHGDRSMDPLILESEDDDSLTDRHHVMSNTRKKFPTGTHEPKGDYSKTLSKASSSKKKKKHPRQVSTSRPTMARVSGTSSPTRSDNEMDPIENDAKARLVLNATMPNSSRRNDNHPTTGQSQESSQTWDPEAEKPDATTKQFKKKRDFVCRSAMSRRSLPMAGGPKAKKQRRGTKSLEPPASTVAATGKEQLQQPNNGGWISNEQSRTFLRQMDQSSGTKAVLSPTTKTPAAANAWTSSRNPQQQQPRKSKTREEALWDGESPKQQYAYQETVRCKEARKGLDCYNCYQCSRFYEVLKKTGHQVPSEYKRHRARFAPPETPEDFWELDFIDERDAAAKANRERKDL